MYCRIKQYKKVTHEKINIVIHDDGDDDGCNAQQEDVIDC